MVGRLDGLKVEPIVENEIIFYKIEFPLKTRLEKYPENINTTQKAIIGLIYSNKRISREEIANKIGLSLEGVKKNIKLLKEKGLLKRIGPDKGGYWEITDYNKPTK